MPLMMAMNYLLDYDHEWQDSHFLTLLHINVRCNSPLLILSVAC